ncbi:hypothetical protein JL721_12105 [Aureococcus anophagefferens]|nr:hypothetical protein JL721_12105 [Aureococcus anophagefferens]
MASNPYGFDSYAPPKAKPPGGAAAAKPSGDPTAAPAAPGGDSHRGKFEGELISEGDLIVGPQGELVGDVKTMSDIVVFGKVIGNIAVDASSSGDSASIYGDITCKVLLMDPTVVLVGNLNINPFAPNKMAPDGSEVGGPKPEKAPEEPAAAADVEGAMFDDAPAAEPEEDAPAADAAEPPAAAPASNAAARMVKRGGARAEAASTIAGHSGAAEHTVCCECQATRADTAPKAMQL